MESEDISSLEMRYCMHRLAMAGQTKFRCKFQKSRLPAVSFQSIDQITVSEAIMRASEESNLLAKTGASKQAKGNLGETLRHSPLVKSRPFLDCTKLD